jgi:hypothetical protein
VAADVHDLRALGPDQLACGDVQPPVAAVGSRALDGDDVPVADGDVDEVRAEGSSGEGSELG